MQERCSARVHDIETASEVQGGVKERCSARVHDIETAREVQGGVKERWGARVHDIETAASTHELGKNLAIRGCKLQV